MTQENYMCTDAELLIEDEELDLHVRLPFNKQGARHLFYPEGQRKAEMFYDKGVLHGPSLFFSPAQQLLAETWYVHGKKTGKVKYYYASGKMASLQRFKEGIPEGVQQYWYEEGTVKSLIPYAQGALHGEVQLFWESGKLKRSCTYSKGVKEGWDRLYNEASILIDEGEFSQGQPIGTHRHFFPDGETHGKVHRELVYHSPTRFDQREWDTSGKLVCEGIYAPDLTYTERKFLEPTRIRKGYWDGQRLCWK